MKLNYLVPSILTAGTVALASSVSLPANAFNIDLGTDVGNCITAASGSNPLNTCTTGDGFTLTSSSTGTTTNAGKLGLKTVSGITGIGVRGGPAGNEISLRTEDEILLELPDDSLLTSLGLAFLYQPGVFGDAVFEIAGVNSTDDIKGTLTVTSDTTADWTWTIDGTNFMTDIITAETSEGSLPGEGGYYIIDNPFGNTPILSTTLFAVSNGSSLGDSNSDFALVLATSRPDDTNPIPEPFTMLGVGTALGFGTFFKKKLAKKGGKDKA